jgi:basic membrane protein A
VAGDRNDGGYYQGQVEAVVAHAEANGWTAIVVDKLQPGSGREVIENLVRQGADLIIAGGAEMSDGMAETAAEPAFSDVNYLLVTGAPPTSDFIATAAADENQAHFMGGVAAGLLLDRSGGASACITGGPELPFVLQMEKSMSAGLEHAQEKYGKALGAELLVTFTGSFEDAALAVEAATAQFNQGCELIYPYLGGAMPAVWGAAAEAGAGVVGTSMDLCGIPGLEFTVMSINYNPMYYLHSIIDSFVAGEFEEGKQLALYGVGAGIGVGANLCDATDDEQQILDEVRAALADGSIDIRAIITG